jgi:hypothetical protein
MPASDMTPSHLKICHPGKQMRLGAREDAMSAAGFAFSLTAH